MRCSSSVPIWTTSFGSLICSTIYLLIFIHTTSMKSTKHEYGCYCSTRHQERITCTDNCTPWSNYQIFKSLRQCLLNTSIRTSNMQKLYVAWCSHFQTKRKNHKDSKGFHRLNQLLHQLFHDNVFDLLP